jgi:DNA invertase Pin-like site-specific DNA recombinase
VAAKRDRLARDVVVAAAVERLAQAAGARVATADGTSSENTPEAFLMRTIMDAFAQYERLLIKARTKAALGVKSNRGELVGSVPFGYELAADGVRLEPNHLEQCAIIRIRELRDMGLPYRKVVEQMAREGWKPRGQQWHLKTVQRILAQPRANGTIGGAQA